MLVCNCDEFAVQARIYGIMTFELESGQASKSADVAANMAGCFASCTFSKTFCWKRLRARNMGYTNWPSKRSFENHAHHI